MIFKVQFYAGMNRVNGFRDAREAERIYWEGMERVFTDRVLEKGYTDEYMTHDPFDITSGVWASLDLSLRQDFIHKRKLTTNIAKTIVFSAKNELRMANERIPDANPYRDNQFLEYNIENSEEMNNLEGLKKSIKILIKNLEEETSHLRICFDFRKDNYKISLVNIRKF